MDLTEKVKKIFSIYVYCFEKCMCSGILFFLIPGYYFYLITYVRRSLVQAYKPSENTETFHLILALFGFINIEGNMLMSVITDAQLKSYIDGEGEGPNYCETCKIYRSAKSWHCTQCNVCILNRDHHCNMFASCIGSNNLRYYILYLVYLSIAMLYYNFFWYFYLCVEFEKQNSTFTFYQMLNSLYRCFWVLYRIFVYEITFLDVEVIMLIINFVIFIWMSFLLFFHGTNLLSGLSTHEALLETTDTLKRLIESRKSWKTNIVRVFGTRWYIAFFWPFVDSPLPINHNDNDRNPQT